MHSSTHIRGDNWYVRWCKRANRLFKNERSHGLKNALNARAPDDLKNAIKFAGLNIEPYECMGLALVVIAIATTVIGAIDISLVILIHLGTLPLTLFPCGLLGLLMIVTLPSAAVPLILWITFVNYPVAYAERLRISALGRMPELINYLAMAMRVSPTLDKALEFVADNVEEPLATAVRTILWNVYMRKYDSVEDAFLAFAYDWGAWNEDFKRALYAVRGAELERTEDGLQRTLEKASDIILSGTRMKIEGYVSSLSGPIMVLFSLGILLPMIVGAMLPMASVSGFKAGALEVFILMNMAFPACTFAYAWRILGKRPGTIAPPKISTCKPNAKKHKALLIVALSCIGLYALSLSLFSWRHTIFDSTLGMLSIIVGIGLTVGYYCVASARAQSKEHNRLKKLEAEFPDALFQLGSRIAEGQPMETALRKIGETMKHTAVAELFDRIAYLIMTSRMTLHNALFGRNGMLDGFPSRMITASMRMVIACAKKDVISAGQTIVGISTYLRDMKKVENDIRTQLGQVTSMMRNTAMFFAPIVLGITTALYIVLAGAFASSAISDAQVIGFVANTSPRIPAPLFTLIIGLYVLMTTCIIMYFCAGIIHGEDRIEKKMAIGKALPVATLVFAIAAIVGRGFVGL